MNGLIQPVNIFKCLLLLVYQQRQKNTKAYNLSVQMTFLYHRISSHGIKNSMGQTAVIIRCTVLCQKNRCNSRCYYNCKNDLLHLVCKHPFFVILIGFRAIIQKGTAAHLTYRNSQCRKMLQTFSSGRNSCFIVFCIGIADSRPHILTGRLCNNLCINKGVHHRADKEMGL